MSNSVVFTRDQFLAQCLVAVIHSSSEFAGSLNNPLFASSDGGTCNEQNIINGVLDNVMPALANGNQDIFSTITQVLNHIDSAKSDLTMHISSLASSFDLGTMPNDITATKAIIEANLDRKISSINLDGLDIDSLTFISLNGASGSFPDGTNVVVSGHKGTFKVSASQMFKNDDDQYMVIYKLEKDGKYSLFPNSMVSIPEGAEV